MNRRDRADLPAASLRGVHRAARKSGHEHSAAADNERDLLDRCTNESLRLLYDNLTPHGILAASPTEAAVARRYTRIFGRDAAICVMAMCGSGVAGAGARRGGQPGRAGGAAGRQRADPEVRRPGGHDADFWYLGCIDATLWWLIALGPRAPRAASAVPTPGSDNVERRDPLAPGAGAPAPSRLLQQNEASDWADIMPRSGFVLYTNALWYRREARATRWMHAEATHHHFNHLFYPFQRDLPEYHRARLLRHYARRGRRDPAST